MDTNQLPGTDAYGYLAEDAWLQINIGRNVDGAPMSDRDWQEFRIRVISALVRYAGASPNDIMTTTGTGPWEDGREDCASFGVFARKGFDLELFRDWIGITAARFDQESIALMIGGELINAVA